jgi:hypothetical protein
MVERYGRFTEEEIENIRHYKQNAVAKIDSMFDEIAVQANELM